MNKQQRLDRDGAIDPILFYNHLDEHGDFSNFDTRHPIDMPHPFTMRVVTYPGGEWRYQACKGRDQEAHDYVLAAPTAFESKLRGNEIALRTHWGNNQGDICWFVMCELLTAKVLQHSDVMELLAETGQRWIYEDSPTDDIWGWRFHQSHSGKNLLGLGWMHTRALVLG